MKTMVLRMKKAVSLLLVSSLVLSLAGCQKAASGTVQSEDVSGQVEMEESTQKAEDAETGNPETEEGGERKMKPWLNTNVAGAVTEDTVADLKDDFYLAVNYDYLKDTKLKEGRNNEHAFQEQQDIINDNLIKLMTDETLEGHDAELVRELYAMWMDWDARNSVGMTELAPHLEKIQQIETLGDLTKYLSSEEGVFYGAGLGEVGLQADMEDAQWYCLYILGTVLSLGDSDEYEELTSVGERNLKAYKEKAGLLLGKAGYGENEAKEIMDNAYAFEEDLAPALMSIAEMREADAPERTLNKVTMEELAQMSPNYPIVEIIKTMGLGESERINVDQPEWLSKINELYTEENLKKIKSYLLVHTLFNCGEDLDEETYRELVRIENESGGVTGSKTDEEMALAAVREYLQTSVSKVYVKEYMSEEVRDDVTNIVKDCIDAYRTMLASEDWLSGETREKALEKLDNITIHVAYPDKWEDTDALQITSRENGGSYFTALNEIYIYKLGLLKERVNIKIDREAWANEMPLSIVNAYYNPLDNSICIIAGILGGDFYKPEMTEEEKLAGIGSVIGHEISHAFDTLGAQFDKDGNFVSWWTDGDYAAFEARAQKLIAYYDTIVPFDDGPNYPGSNIQGEAIADIAGVKCMLLLAREEKDFDYDVFFRTYAKMWKKVSSREYCEMAMYQDAHPMAYLRVNVTLMQQPEFYETYDIKEGDGMYMAEEDRIPVW